MNTLGSLQVHRRTTDAPPGAYTVNIADLNFSSEFDYEVWPLCGHGFVRCNNRGASPAVLLKTATSFGVVVVEGPVVWGIFPLVGRTKVNV